MNKMRDCVIYFSNSDYMKETAGTEKFLMNAIEKLLAENIHAIQVFPIRKVNRWIKKLHLGEGEEYVAINVDGKYYGAFNFKKLKYAIRTIAKKNYFFCCGVLINQMNYFDCDLLSEQILALNLPVRYIVHDFTTVCPFVFWPGKTGTACNTELVIPSEKYCKNCNYFEAAIENYEKSKVFFKKISAVIDMVICPSESAQCNWNKAFPMNFSQSIRPHLSYGFDCVRKKVSDKIRIAYMGQVSSHKGLNEWNELISKLPDEDYEFYYLGNSEAFLGNPKVKTVCVDFQKKDSMNMQEQLEHLQIDMVFQWSKCQETYSYTYFEAFAAGCFVITNNYSGNIAAMTQKYYNGRTFDRFEECKEWFLNGDARHDLEHYYDDGKRIIGLKMNPDSSAFMFKSNKKFELQGGKRVIRNPFLYFIGQSYYLQH